jgi:CubicO group peptidase (beta-lactamase class C family)/Zn-dependent protease with chaperone function
MTSQSDLLATPIMQTLGLTLVHFLWQGTLVALVVAVVLYVLKDSSASTRYVISCAGLAVMILSPLATFAYLAPSVKPVYQFTDSPRAALQVANVQPSASAPATEATNQASNISTNADVQTTSRNTDVSRFTFTLRPFKLYLPWLVALWLAGVLILSARLMGGLWLARQLRTKATKPVSEMLESTLRDLASKLNISKNIKLRESLAVKVPVVIGWLRPVILLPSSAITGLSVKQLELILAHELAHIRRHDYIVNLLQKIAETLLFYHPAVWWISGVIRQERENCCDDLAITVCEGDRLSYAKTLSLLDTMRPSNRIALAADGGSLLRRIQRLAGKPTNAVNPAQWLIGLVIILVPWLLISIGMAQAKIPKEIEENIDSFVEQRLNVWGVPGIQVAVVQGGEVTLNKAYGLADIESNTPMTVDTPIQIGDGGWFIPRIAVHKLIEEGKLNLDDIISEHLPWVRFKNGEETKTTVEQLMYLTTNIIDKVHFDGLRTNPMTKSELSSDITSEEDYIRSLMPDMLYTLPGSYFASTTIITNDVLLSLIIEKASGMSFEEYIKQSIFTPLEMNATYNTDDVNTTGLATLYQSAPTSSPVMGSPKVMDAKTFTISQSVNAAYGLISSSRDLTKFLSALVNEDTRLLSAQSWKLLFPEEADGEYPKNWRGFYSTLGGTVASEVFMQFVPSRNLGYLTLSNYTIPNYDHPLYEVIGSVGISLLLLNDGFELIPNQFEDKRLANPSAATITNISGTYISALGKVEVFGENNELHGTMLGHEFKLESVAFSYLIRSDFEKINGLLLKADNQQLMLEDRPFAFRVK